MLAVALTGLALMLWGAPDAPAQQPASDTAAVPATADSVPPVEAMDSLPPSVGAAGEAAQGVDEAAGTIRGLTRGVYRLGPKLLIALAILAGAALLVRGVRGVLRLALARTGHADAISVLAGIGIWLLALGVALSVLAGDARALVGSVGLFGLALSWALQAPIESFTGWLLNSFRGYYRVGDRILVGDVFGDVYDIDILTTRVWEAGGPGKAVQGAQPTGALITFPNSDVLRANITNFTRDFPYVWDEILVGVTNESDLAYAIRVIGAAAERTVGDTMVEPAAAYARLLDRSGLAFDIAPRPQLFVSPTDAWTDIVVRYLVPARERRQLASELQLAVAAELAKPEHAGRVIGSYPYTRVQLSHGTQPPPPPTAA